MISEQIPVLASYFPNQYLRAFIILVVLVVTFKVGLYILERILLKLASKTESDADDKLIEASSNPVNFLSVLLALQLSIDEIKLGVGLSTIITKLIITLTAINVVYLIYIFINNFLLRGVKHLVKKTKSELDDGLVGLAQGAIKVALIIIGIIFILDSWGVEVGPFLAGLGIAGVAVALAIQPTLANIFSGIALILDQTFKIGDVIKLDSGLMGEVYKIGLRTTKIKTFDNEMIIVPNSKLADATVQNLFQPDRSVRVNIEFGVEYGNDPEYVKKIALEEIEKSQLVDKKKDMRVLFTDLGASSLNFKCMFWVEDIDNKWPAHQEVIARIYRRLYEEGIGMPFPQSTVWLRNEKNFTVPNPKDKKFKGVQGKYLSAYGKEYVAPKKETKEESKEKKTIFDHLNKLKFKKNSGMDEE